MADTGLTEILEYHNDVVSSLSLYFSIGRRPDEIALELTARLLETELRSAFAILGRLEAAFRLDYECRCRRKMKDDLSRAFRAIHKVRKHRVSLDEDIFEAWKQNATGLGKLIGELRSAFRFRHWLAHGRYWRPKLGRKYDFTSVQLLAENVLSAFPFCDLN